MRKDESRSEGRRGPTATETDRHINSERLNRLLTDLSRFGSDPRGGTSRIAFSGADQAGRLWVMERMKEAGLEVWVDAAANIHGRRPEAREPSLPAILFGSHIDTVPQGGNFDGTLGSLGALEVLMTLRDEEVETRHPLEMVIWSDEEGVHYGKGLFGSRAATVGLDPGELDLADDEGVSLAEWLRRYGVDPAGVEGARLDARKVAAYLELHIEQGPFLYRETAQIGVVDGIVGTKRYNVEVEGFANHAGTTLMDERKDALVAAAQLTQAVREEVMARPGRQVGNIGWMKVLPGATNVIPRRVTMPIELRDLDEVIIEEVMDRIRGRARDIARERDVSIAIDLFAQKAPALTDPGLKHLIAGAAKQAGFSAQHLPSGAGHDAQMVAGYGIPTGMIFVRSKDGVSHAPTEWTDGKDCGRGVEVLYRTILKVDAQ